MCRRIWRCPSAEAFGVTTAMKREPRFPGRCRASPRRHGCWPAVRCCRVWCWRPSVAIRAPACPPRAFGRGTLLFLPMIWSPVLRAFTRARPRMSSRGVFLVRVSFWLWAAVASRLVRGLLPDDVPVPPRPHTASGDFRGPGRRYWIYLVLVPLLLYSVTRVTVAAHAEPRPGSPVRFSRTLSAN